jgi:3-dehydroquinate dehydratase
MLRRTLSLDRPHRHTSMAPSVVLRDPKEPLIDADLSNIYHAETFWQHSCVSCAAMGVICGSGPRGHGHGLDALAVL